MRNILIENAPIKAEALYDLIHREYGYDIRIVPSYLSHLSEYYYRGMYSLGHKEMSEERMEQFKEVLPEDFYTFDELKKIYCETFENADKDEVNSFNLKRMGFIVNSKYVVQHYASASKYIEAMLSELYGIEKSAGDRRIRAESVYQLQKAGARRTDKGNGQRLL
jgi:hypothetical protein